jgi:hypothetical protein
MWQTFFCHWVPLNFFCHAIIFLAFSFGFQIACHRCKKKLCSKYTRKYQADLHESKQLLSNILKSRYQELASFSHQHCFGWGSWSLLFDIPWQPEVSCPEVEPKYLAQKWYCFLHLSWNLVED